jgi:undecaprenyl-diphosphatase
MIETLMYLDREIFIFINRTIANPVLDLFFPVLTDLNKHWYGWLAYGTGWLFLMLKCGKRGRTAGILLILLVAFSDQLNSSVLKALFHRPRPCHLVGGIPVVEHVRLLVDCGGGYSFPSSHAVNNIAAATLLSFFYRRWSWAFFLFASLMALSRPYVGAHYPSDIVAGAMVGVLCAFVVLGMWRTTVRQFPALGLDE